MNLKNIASSIGLALAVFVLPSCQDQLYNDIAFVDKASAPSKLSALFEITQDNTGLVTITPNGEGVAYFSVASGLAGATPATVNPGGKVQWKYPEGNHSVVVKGFNVGGKSTETTLPLTVSFKAPENVEMTATIDPANPKKVNVTAKGLYETNFKAYFGETANEVPVSFNEGQTISYTYNSVGTFTIKVVALSGGAASTTVTQNVTIVSPVMLPLDFETAGQEYTFSNFDGGSVSIINNPQKSGINTSSRVGRMIKFAGQPWGGSLITLGNAIDFSVNKFFAMKVFSPRVGAKVLLKVENATDGSISYEKEVATTKANAWEDLSFDFSAINTTKSYHKVVLIFDLGTMGDGSANYTFLFDDIRLYKPVTAESLTVPLTFESSSLKYDFVNFDGGNASVVDNPQKTGINTSLKVGKMVKSAGQSWGGSFITLESPIDFSAKKTFKMKVYSPRVGAKVLLKVENLTNGAVSFEKEVTTTKANAWEELTFDYSSINASQSYQKIVLIFDLGTMGDGSANFTYWFDDIILQ